MISLSRTRRHRLTAIALTLLTAGVATLPLKVRGEAGSMVPARTRITAHVGSDVSNAVMPRRDPFAGGAPLVRRPLAASVPPLVAPIAGRAPAEPPSPPSMPAAPRVTAIVTGERSYALVEDAGRTRVVTAGDRLSGQRIAWIAIDGVHLAGGATLSVAPGAALPTGVR